MGKHTPYGRRDDQSGRYIARLTACCACGHTLGEHTAARVNDIQHCLSEGCTCASFTKPRAAIARARGESGGGR